MLRCQVRRFVGMGTPTSSGLNIIKNTENTWKNTSYETNNKNNKKTNNSYHNKIS